MNKKEKYRDSLDTDMSTENSLLGSAHLSYAIGGRQPLTSGAEFDAVPVILAKDEQKRPEYLKVNPLARVPALAIQGQVITEVIGILAWIAHRYPQANLLPLSDPLTVGRTFSVLSRYATTLAVCVAQMARTERFTSNEELWPQLRSDGQIRFQAGMAEIERSFDGEWDHRMV